MYSGRELGKYWSAGGTEVVLLTVLADGGPCFLAGPTHLDPPIKDSGQSWHSLNIF